MSDNNYTKHTLRFGVPDQFIEQGSQEEQRRECGYDKQSIVEAIKNIISKK